MNNKKRPLLSAIGSFLKSFFTENISIKIIALLFAILLWGYVLTIENPEYVKIVRDVEITYTGENSLTAKGLMLVNREIGTTDVSVLCQIGKHSELDASRLSCVVDLSSREISLAEDEDSKVIPLTVETTIQNGYGSIQSVETSTVNVEVAKVSSRNSIPVGIEMKGSIPEGFQVSVPDRVLISVSGMKSLVDAIARGMVTIDLEAFPINDPENLAGTYSGVYPVRFYNSGNVELEDIYNNSGDSYTSEVTVTIRAYKDVEVEPDIRVEDLYTYTYTLSREYVRVFGELEELEKIDSNAFANDPKLYEIVIPGSPVIGARAIGYKQNTVDPVFLIAGEPGSSSHTYATDNNIAFCDVKDFDLTARQNSRKTPGDVDGNSVISVADAVKLQSWLFNKPIEDYVPGNMDVNSDGKVNSLDMIAIRQKLAKTK